jgi:hypothetical protein
MDAGSPWNALFLALAQLAVYLLSRRMPKSLETRLSEQDEALVQLHMKVALALEHAESANRKGARLEARANITPDPTGEPRTGMHELPIIQGVLERKK